MEPLKYKKALIKVGYTCNNNCIFCHSKDLRIYPQMDIENIFYKIKEAKELGIEMIVFSGGEVTIREDFFNLAKLVKAWDLKLGLITNGKMFSYDGFLKETLKYNLEYIYVSLPGATASSHNKQVQATSFLQTINGIKKLSKKNLTLTVNVVINKNNLKDLKKIYNILLPLENIRLKYSLLEPKGEGFNRFEELAVNPKTSAEKVQSIINYVKNTNHKIQVGCDGFTPCLIKNYNNVNMDLFTDKFLFISEVPENKFYNVDYGRRSYALECYECAIKNNCPGIYNEYLNKFNSFLKPFISSKSNSFFYFPVLKINFSKNNCEIKPDKYNPVRDIFLKKNNYLELYKTETTDFSTEEIKNIKYLQQIYINLTGKVRNINYGKDLKKLVLIKMCKRCRKNSVCPAIYEISDKNIFIDFEELLKNEIKKLRGRVCDVGCGKMPFFELINNLIKTKKIKYIGVDPQRENIKGLKIYKTKIENFNWQGNYFDYILIIRSYNHFYNLKKTFDNIYKILKNDGEVIIIENFSFGLLREKNPSLPYRTKPIFHHYRNATLQNTISFLKNYKFKIIERKEVNKDSSNQWYLRIKKE